MRAPFCLSLIALVSSSVGALASGVAEDRIGPSQRGLVVIANLSEMRTGAHWVAYKLEEERAVRVVDRLTRAHYGQRLILEPAHATRENFFQALHEMESRPEIQVIDVVVYLHGLRGRLCFKGQIGPDGESPCAPMQEVADRILTLGTHAGPMTKLRMLYSDACYGESHMEEWLRAGFRTVNGSLLQDANKSWDLQAFLRRWTRGRTYEEAMARANDLAITPIMDRIVGGQSFKEIRGQRDLQIESP